jgi:transcriptional regulator with XRE-family HTH domain
MTRRAPRRETPSLGGAIRRWREERSLTQHELARLIDTSEQNVSNWEKGVRPRSRHLIDALDCALDAGGEISHAYTGGGDLADRVVELEQRMANIEKTRDIGMPMIRENAEELTRLWDEVRRLAGAVQRLVDLAPQKRGSPRGSGR